MFFVSFVSFGLYIYHNYTEKASLTLKIHKQTSPINTAVFTSALFR